MGVFHSVSTAPTWSFLSGPYPGNDRSQPSAFDSEWLCIRKEYSVFLDNTPDIIKEAAKVFFTRKFHDKLIDVQFKDKVSGSRSGAVCTVSFDEREDFRIWFRMTYEEQLRIAKEFIDQCGISLKLDEALAKLDEDKEVFRRSDLLFSKGTEALGEYITIVREKITQIYNL